VLLTPGKVALARDEYPETALLIVSAIELSTREDGTLSAQGGSVKVVKPWDPDAAGELRPLGFYYLLHDE
jgi:hypothetical protein